MSYFMPPIAPLRDEQGRIVTPATLLPFCEVSVDYLQRKPQAPDRASTQHPGHTDGKSHTPALRDSLRHIHPSLRQVFRIPLTTDSDRRRPPRLL